MTMALLPVFIESFNKNVRAYVSEDEHVLLTLDTHKSRNGIEWLNTFIKYNIELEQVPTNTTHSLQPCDAFVNKEFKINMSRFQDYI